MGCMFHNYYIKGNTKRSLSAPTHNFPKQKYVLLVLNLNKETSTKMYTPF